MATELPSEQSTLERTRDEVHHHGRRDTEPDSHVSSVVSIRTCDQLGNGTSPPLYEERMVRAGRALRFVELEGETHDLIHGSCNETCSAKGSEQGSDTGRQQPCRVPCRDVVRGETLAKDEVLGGGAR